MQVGKPDLGPVDVEMDEARLARQEGPGVRAVLVGPGADQEDLVAAYAISIHRSQGSEFSAVVIPVHTQHFVMLRRNLLYTAVTRGKQLVVLVGSEMAVSLAARRGSDRTRFSALALRAASARDQAARRAP